MQPIKVWLWYKLEQIVFNFDMCCDMVNKSIGQTTSFKSRETDGTKFSQKNNDKEPMPPATIDLDLIDTPVLIKRLF